MDNQNNISVQFKNVILPYHDVFLYHMKYAQRPKKENHTKIVSLQSAKVFMEDCIKNIVILKLIFLLYLSK